LNVDKVSIVTVRDLMLVQSHTIRTLALPQPIDGQQLHSTESERATVDAVLAEAKHPGYIHKVNAPGNRYGHYKHHANHGATAVTHLRDVHSWVLLQVWLRGVKSDIDKQLPGKYHFFEPASLHVTLRGLWVDRATSKHHDHL
jgi:hypothetical protein